MATPSVEVSTAGFDRLYGLEVVELDDERAAGKVAVQDELKHQGGAVHGGVYAAIAEGLTMIATERALTTDGGTATALSTQTSLLRPITAGAIHTAALARHRGRTTWVWEVEMTDDEGRLCASSRVTVAVRPRPRAPSP